MDHAVRHTLRETRGTGHHDQLPYIRGIPRDGTDRADVDGVLFDRIEERAAVAATERLTPVSVGRIAIDDAGQVLRLDDEDGVADADNLTSSPP
jgi:hypothetical protein